MDGNGAQLIGINKNPLISVDLYENNRLTLTVFVIFSDASGLTANWLLTRLRSERSGGATGMVCCSFKLSSPRFEHMSAALNETAVGQKGLRILQQLRRWSLFRCLNTNASPRPYETRTVSVLSTWRRPVSRALIEKDDRLV